MRTSLLLLTIVTVACGSSSSSRWPSDPLPGVTAELATQRAATLSDIRYALSLTVPADAKLPLSGRVSISFTLKDSAAPLVIDFAPGANQLSSVSIAGKAVTYKAINGHIVIAPGQLRDGTNIVDIAFQPGDLPLNRNADFLYSLFVPARAHLAFPCFDQPNLKARFTLDLTIPADWVAVSNGSRVSTERRGDTVHATYAETQPISTYLFAFAAGKFQIEEASRNGRSMRMFHRETDAAKVARNRDAVFDLHAAALRWLEDYTDIPYQFGRFDFLLVPSFQFGGMEHPGSIFYNAASVLLDESATESQVLNRASLIAHETTHMWFGDLVTMEWFDDVWMKEVFANFMAARIVNPSFPHVDHELRFLVAHYPAAYSVDRTAGTVPIRQALSNLNDAGSQYGPIIYQKAPIVMRQLERSVGATPFRDGLRDYLKGFMFGNASWLQLVKLLDARTEVDVTRWSRAWVEAPGRPTIRSEVVADADQRLERVSFLQSDSQSGRGLVWPQQLDVLVGSGSTSRHVPVALEDARANVPGPVGLRPPWFVLPTGGGLAYGDFVLDSSTRAFLLAQVETLPDPVSRGAAWVTLWEEMLDDRVAPPAFVDTALRALPRETVEQNIQLVTGYITRAFWRFLSDEERGQRAVLLERTLRAGIDKAPSSSLKSTFFSALYSTAFTSEAVSFVERVWRRQQSIPGLTLAEPDEATMALELAVRGVKASAEILATQRDRFQNPDRKARFEFVMPAVDASEAVRDQFFAKLHDVQNRRREPWVVEGLHYLNHPLRAAASRKHLRPSLDLLEDVQRTGDIFFPTNWMDAVLYGYRDAAAADIVRGFLAEHPDYPIRLRRTILQTADELFRASAR